jgi:tryptophan synthase alpha chain
MITNDGAGAIERSLRGPRRPGGPGLVPFLTAGFPTKESFRALIEGVADRADVLEIGVPFSDPMADGVSIQRASRRALENGVTLAWILEELRAAAPYIPCPVVLMSYVNPLLAYGVDRLVEHAAVAGVAGLIVPDLPLEESHLLGGRMHRHGLALVQMVTPVTPADRMKSLAEASAGFVYAVTMTGTTGTAVAADRILDYLDRVRDASRLPVCAGFGIRTAEQIDLLRGHTDGVIVGSALVDALDRGGDAVAFLDRLTRA